MIKVAMLALGVLVGCGEGLAPADDGVGFIELPTPARPITLETPSSAHLDALPELDDPTLVMLEAGCPIAHLRQDDLVPCGDGLCLDGTPVAAEVDPAGQLTELTYPGTYTVRCEGDAINENWWQDGQWQRQRITTMRAHDTFGVTSGLTEEISPVATQVIRFDITRNTDGEVTETRRRLFPSRGEGVCRDELRVHAEGDYALEIFDCMAGW